MQRTMYTQWHHQASSTMAAPFLYLSHLACVCVCVFPMQIQWSLQRKSSGGKKHDASITVWLHIKESNVIYSMHKAIMLFSYKSADHWMWTTDIHFLCSILSYPPFPRYSKMRNVKIFFADSYLFGVAVCMINKEECLGSCQKCADIKVLYIYNLFLHFGFCE